MRGLWAAPKSPPCGRLRSPTMTLGALGCARAKSATTRSRVRISRPVAYRRQRGLRTARCSGSQVKKWRPSRGSLTPATSAPAFGVPSARDARQTIFGSAGRGADALRRGRGADVPRGDRRADGLRSAPPSGARSPRSARPCSGLGAGATRGPSAPDATGRRRLEPDERERAADHEDRREQGRRERRHDHGSTSPSGGSASTAKSAGTPCAGGCTDASVPPVGGSANAHGR